MILKEFVGVRFFKGDKKKRIGYQKKYKEWDNDSHFIRCACIVYMKYLDKKAKSLNKVIVKK